MKRILSIGLFCVFLLLAAVFAAAPFASAASRITDPAQLDDNAVYTKEDMLAMYELGYSKGYQDGLDARSASTPAVAANTAPATGSSASCDYVLNTNTKKFHYPNCKSVGDISDKNKSFFTGTREEAIAAGYSPCGRCKP